VRAVLSAIQEGRDRRHAAGLSETVEDAASFAGDVIAEASLDGGVSSNRGWSMLKKLRVKVLQRVLERVRLGARESALNDVHLSPRSRELRLHKVHGIAETTSIVAGKTPKQSDCRRSILGELIRVLMNGKLNLVLALQLGHKVMGKLGRLEKLDQLRASSKNEFMLVRNHAQELVNAVGNLPLRAIHGHLVAGLLGAGEVDLAVVLLLELVNLRKPSNELAMVESINTDDLRGILGVLNRH
jgi:hypothetical protein